MLEQKVIEETTVPFDLGFIRYAQIAGQLKDKADWQAKGLRSHCGLVWRDEFYDFDTDAKGMRKFGVMLGAGELVVQVHISDETCMVRRATNEHLPNAGS